MLTDQADWPELFPLSRLQEVVVVGSGHAGDDDDGGGGDGLRPLAVDEGYPLGS